MEKDYNRELSRRQVFLSGAYVLAGATLSGVLGSEPASAALNPRARGAKIKNLVYGQSVAVTSLATMGTQPQAYPAGYEAAFAIYSGLVRFKKNLSIEPDLATSWSSSEDGLTWTFNLRKGVKFHDGSSFNADVVVAYFTKMLDNKYNVSAYGLWSPISSVKKIDDDTITITTVRLYSAFINVMAHGSALIPSPKVVEKGATEASLNPVGTGPYQVDKFEPGTRLVLKANPNYWGVKPVYATISYVFIADATARVAALQAGQVNVIDSVPVQEVSRLAAASNINVINIPGLQVFGVGMNFNNPILKNVKVRQAMNYATDVQSICNSIFRGLATPITSPLAPRTNGFSTSGVNKYDPVRAIKLFKDAGLVQNKDGMFEHNGQPVNFRFRFPDGLYPNDLLVAAAIQDQLKKVGINTTLNKTTVAAFWPSIRVARADVDFDLALFGFNPSHGSGALQLDIMYRANVTDGKVSGWNFNWYNNPKVNDLLDKALTTVKPAEWQKTMKSVGRQIWSDSPYIWLYVRNIISAYDDKAATPLVLPVVFTIPSRSAN